MTRAIGNLESAIGKAPGPFHDPGSIAADGKARGACIGARMRWFAAVSTATSRPAPRSAGAHPLSRFTIPDFRFPAH